MRFFCRCFLSLLLCLRLPWFDCQNNNLSKDHAQIHTISPCMCCNSHIIMQGERPYRTMWFWQINKQAKWQPLNHACEHATESTDKKWEATLDMRCDEYERKRKSLGISAVYRLAYNNWLTTIIQHINLIPGIDICRFVSSSMLMMVVVVWKNVLRIQNST